MPFQSERQRSYLFANKPTLAKKWSRKYGSKPKKRRTPTLGRTHHTMPDGTVMSGGSHSAYLRKR